MKWRTFVLFAALVMALLLFAHRRSSADSASRYARVTDLTRVVPQDANADHSITRLDAPSNSVKGMWRVDQIPAERLVRPLVILNVRGQAQHDSAYRVSMQDVAAFEHRYGRIPDGAVVMAYTGYDDSNSATNRQGPYPGFTLEAVEFLTEARGAVAFGVDSPSPSGVGTDSDAVRHYSANHSVYHLENLGNLAAAPPSGAVAIVTPVKVAEGTAPVRVLALVR